MEYQPIDYTTWDLSGQGRNVFDLLLPTEKKIWKTALPYQDERDDAGHAENVTYFTLKLLKHVKDADRSIVVPAAILHDIGWGQMSKVELKLFYDDNWERYEPTLRARHQEEGVRLAKQILEQIGYPQEQITQILEIISQHDTRKGFLSPEDGVMRDADKLWRYTVPIFDISTNLRGVQPEEFFREAIEEIPKPGFFYSDAAKEIARIELENTRKHLENTNKL